MLALHQTPLHQWHKANGAFMAPFHGWDMPMHYAAGSVAEHLHTRKLAGLFDLSHMGEFLLEGKGAAEALANNVAANIHTLPVGRCRYAFLLNEHGGIKNDLVLYRLKEETFMLVVNPHCTAEDFSVLSKSLPSHILFENISASLSKIDLQGPQSFAVLEDVLSGPWKRLSYYGCMEITLEGIPLIASRTGYTGELGVELYCPQEHTQKLWNMLLADTRVLPAGIEARDTLRLEAGLPLYGQDLDENHTPAEAGFAGSLTSQARYVGKSGAFSIESKLTPLRIEGTCMAQVGAPVHSAAGAQVGTITSSLFSPSLQQVIALAYIDADCLPQDYFYVDIESSKQKCHVDSLPFYKNGTAKALIL